MADEDAVLRNVELLLRTAQLADRYRLLVGRWVENGLPPEPVEGLVGREQLLHAAGVLREVATDVASVAELSRLFDGQAIGFSFGTATQQVNSFTLSAQPGQSFVDWSRQLVTVADTIDAFVEPESDGDGG